MRSFWGGSLAVAAIAAISAAGCTQVGVVKARKNFKEANQAYQAQDYRRAASLYELAVAADPNVDEGSAYFYLGNSYDNQWKPSKKGDLANDALLNKAAQNYATAAEKLNQSPKPEKKKLAK